MSGYKTTYSTDENQLYISDVNSYYNWGYVFPHQNGTNTEFFVTF